ncbi:hypothetical protein [Pseudobutyrivibrio sp.]|uniref:hypothetical protein n=1 Tax=Pseudobutyrivibrio sp. TaxID=2014367 RepID=UPI001B2BE48F|nr:hypothetical protein [Pseudobutyrivibrio sp.]MBO5617888.1 hypothetical protein [Pseudobutyrivibrio sp.]MBP3261655.1 hypothetical protein [Pseudobutyrivibrio sp.]
MNRKMVKTAGLTALSAVVLMTGCGKINPNETLVTINTGDAKDTISLGYGNFAARYQQSMYDQYLLSYYGEDMWKSDMSGSGSTLEEDTKDGVLEDMESQYLTKLHASDYGVELTEDQKNDIAKAAKKFISDNSKESLEAMGATEEYVKEYLEYRTYYSLVSAAAKEASDADIKDEDCWMRTFTYVLFDTTGKKDEEGNVTEYTDDEIAELKTQAKELSTSEDFDAKVEELGLTTQNYSYLKGESEDSTMDMSIISEAEKLKEGEQSGVIVVDGVGFYVIKLTADHDEDASQTKRESLQSEAFDKLLDEWKEAITWKVNDKAWEKVKFDSLFKAPETEESKEDDTTTESTENTTATDETEAE